MKKIDLHQDLLLHMNNPEYFNDKNQTSWDAINESNLKIVGASVFVIPPEERWHDPVSNDLISKSIDEYNEYCKNSSSFQIVKSRKDVVSILRNDQAHGILIHIEGLNSFEDKKENWRLLDDWYEKGLRSLGIVWNVSNSLGGGTNDPGKGLSGLGRKVVLWALERGVILDYSHMSRKTFFDVLEINKGPIMVSHGNAAKLCDCERNYTDEQLKIIAKSEGIIGLFFSSRFVKPKDTGLAFSDDLVEHVLYMRRIMGVNSIALGTDLGGVTSKTVVDIDSVTKLDVLKEKLLNKSFSLDDVERIFYKNAERFLCKVLN